MHKHDQIKRCRDVRRELVGCVLDRVGRKVRIPRRRLHLRMPEQLGDHRQALT